MANKKSKQKGKGKQKGQLLLDVVDLHDILGPMTESSGVLHLFFVSSTIEFTLSERTFRSPYFSATPTTDGAILDGDMQLNLTQKDGSEIPETPGAYVSSQFTPG